MVKFADKELKRMVRLIMKKLWLLVGIVLFAAWGIPVNAQAVRHGPPPGSVNYNYSYTYTYSTGSTSYSSSSKTIKRTITTAPTKEIQNLASGYVIDSFESRIRLNQDTTLSVEEVIGTDFMVPKHGIFRIIPYIYSAKGRTITGEISDIEVKDENGKNVNFTTERVNQSISIKMGDANRTITGKHRYIINYKVHDVVLDYGEGPEIYWNVTGHEWDTTINSVKASVTSNYGTIEKTECFSGNFGGTEKNCQQNNTQSEASFTATESLGSNKDMTIGLQISKNNQLKFPGIIERTTKNATDNWGYLAAIGPTILMGIFWFKRGRDQKFSSGNVYYKPEKTNTENVGLFSRPHLPMVYGPIDNLSPAEVGTIIDQKVDLKDIVAEITELGRLGYLTIERTEKKKFLSNEVDYIFKGTGKDASGLPDFQQYLLESIFDKKKTKKTETEVNGVKSEGRKEISYEGEIKLSDLKEKFYVHLEPLRKKIYKSLILKGAIEEDPRMVQLRWVMFSILINMAGFVGSVYFAADTYNGGPIGVWVLGLIPSFVFAANMPKRTAWGYSLYRQTVGLQYYVSKGKWREEIAEKKLFLEEILPLAIALGVVNKLAHDMEGLGLQPPSYFQGNNWSNFNGSLYHFSHQSYSTFVTTPVSASYHSGWSGNSSWSGGSGFGGGGFSGGGSSGGGFGGGGGGSW